MLGLLIAIIYLSFFGLGLPDSMLGAAWPTIFAEMDVPVSGAGIISAIIAFGTIISSLASDRVTRKLGASKTTAISVAITALALLGFGISTKFWHLCLISIPYGLGAGSVDAALNNYVSFHFASKHTVPKLSRAPELVSGATPLSVLSAGEELPSLLDMFLGLRGGAIGETCAIAIILGFIYLVARRVINFETPLIFVGTVFVLSLIFDNSFSIALYNILAGGLLFGAVFMATDYVTTPITRTGKMVFAVGCGLITFLIRSFGNYPEGVSFAILFMNILSPYIEKWTAKRPLGGKK